VWSKSTLREYIVFVFGSQKPPFSRLLREPLAYKIPKWSHLAKSLREISDQMGLSLTTTARILKTA
jgi:hypothetical protein